MITEKPLLYILPDTRKATATMIIVFALTVLPPRKSHAEDSLDTKFMYYQEDKNRIRVLAPEFSVQHENDSGWTIKLEGIYNAITGATPTGAPPVASTPAPISQPSSSAPSSGGGGGGSSSPAAPTPAPPPPPVTPPHEVNDSFISHSVNYPAALYSAVTAATPVAPPPPAPTPSPSPSPAPSTSSGSSSGGGGSSSGGGSQPAAPQQPAAQPASSRIPLAKFHDARWAFNLGLSKRVGDQTPSIQGSYSQESDYLSTGISLQDAIDFNKKNTTLAIGGAFTHDTLTPANGRPSVTKESIDAMLGISQVLTKTTVLSANITFGEVTGFISDPYKLAEVNGQLMFEKRPDSKNKQILFVGLQQFITPLDASIDIGLRHYTDSYGINAETLSLAWFQKVSPEIIVSPIIRYYTQTAAKFYDVRFTGYPEFYSSDYRISNMDALSYGIKVIWSATTDLRFDAGVERYQLTGKDGKTDPEMYPSSLLFIVGAHYSF